MSLAFCNYVTHGRLRSVGLFLIAVECLDDVPVLMRMAMVKIALMVMTLAKIKTAHMAPQLEGEGKEYSCLWLDCKVRRRARTLFLK